jgi:hypothetical protein
MSPHSLYSDHRARLRTATDNGLKASRKISRGCRKKRGKRKAKGTPSSSLVSCCTHNKVLTCTTQTAPSVLVTRRRLTRSQMVSSWRYFTSVGWATTLMDFPSALYWSGDGWYTYAEGGDISYLIHHSNLICSYAVHTGPQSGRICVAGHPYLSSLTTTPIGTLMKARALLLATKMTSWPHWSTPVGYAMLEYL